MAQKRKLDQETSCSICQDLMKDPVIIPCRHSFCKRCIKNHWDGEDQKKAYTCPRCSEGFKPRPALVKNTKLAESEELKKTGCQAAAADLYAGAEDVSCDVCSDKKLRAVKSCLDCLVSFCKKDLQPHYNVGRFKKHQLVEPSKKLQENICPRHDEVMKIFCRTDQQCICYLCTMDEHKGHEMVPVKVERAEKQKELEESRQQIQQRIQERQKDVKLLQQEVEAINVSADKTEEDSEKIFTQLIKLKLIRLIQERSSDVKQQLRSQLETEVSEVLELQKKVKRELVELKRKDGQLEQLSHTEDHKQFLHNYPSVSALSESPHSSSIKTRPLRYFQDVTAAVEELRDKIQDNQRDTCTNVSMRGTKDVLSKHKILKHSQELTLDPNTAHRQLMLSEGNRKATVMEHQLSYPDHPDRFTDCQQVLSRESLSGRCYLEVQWSGKGIYFAVSYKDIRRNGNQNDCVVGYNDKSWALCCNTNSYVFYHNNNHTLVSGPASYRVGVYLDHRAGVLSFYSVSDTMTLLHRVQTTFTQPLHAGVWLIGCGTTVEFIKTNRRG